MAKPRKETPTLLYVCADCGDVKKKRFELVDGMPREINSNNSYWISKKYCPSSTRRLMEKYEGQYNYSVCPDCQEIRDNRELK